MNSQDLKFQAHSLKELRPIAVRMQIMATVCQAAVTAVNQYYLGTVATWTWLLVLVTAATPFLTARVTEFWQYRATGFLMVLSMVTGLSVLVGHASHSYMWFLLIGLSITLTSPAVYHHVWAYLLTGGVVWCILFWLLQPTMATDMETLIVLLVILGSMSTSAFTAALFRKLRWNSYFLQQQLHEIANVDALTELPNRRAFLHRMDALLKLPPQTDGVYFLMLDVDDFKKINDQFGHDAGDRALVAIARALEQSVGTHCVGRLGGEEFAVAAPLSNNEAHALAHNILEAVHGCLLQGRRLSMSIGMARRLPDEPADSLMRRADLALYDAKSAGKNRYVLAAT